MRISLLLRSAMFCGLFALGSSLALAQDTFSYGGSAVAIPDDGYDGSMGSMGCVDLDNSGGTIVEIVGGISMDMEITHTWVGDLTVKVFSPAGTETTAMATPGQPAAPDDGSTCCGNNDDLDGTPINFADGNPTNAEDMGLGGVGVCTGDGLCDYAPNPDGAPGTDFSDFDGESAIGIWTVCVGDGAGGDVGEIFDFTITLDGNIPVELVSFDAVLNGTDVKLEWATASETNNAGFEVQILNGEAWDALGWVEGNGTTTEAHTYSFEVGGMDVGTHAFRLKQIDFDGAFEYHGNVEVTIETPGTHVVSAAYPNPFNPQSQFTMAVSQEQHVSAELYNTLGQRVAVLFDGTVQANQPERVTIDAAGLASGVYVVRVNGERFSESLNVTLLK